MKICNSCKEEKSIEQFQRKVKNNGKVYYANRCKDCNAELRRIKEGTTTRRRPKGFLDSRLTGTLPQPGEVSIYVLYKSDGEVFYVGQTINPRMRVSEHIQTFQIADLTLAILKNVHPDEAVYWEAKALVDYTDAGYKLVNTQTPKTGKKRKGWLCQT